MLRNLRLSTARSDASPSDWIQSVLDHDVSQAQIDIDGKSQPQIDVIGGANHQNDSMHSFGQALRRARIRSKLNQDQLGHDIGVSGASVSAWERDKVRPTFENLVALRGVLHTSLDELLFGDRTLAQYAQAHMRMLVGSPSGLREKPSTFDRSEIANRLHEALDRVPDEVARALLVIATAAAGSEAESPTR